MRAPLAPALLALLAAGCASPLESGTPVVVVVHEFTWTPEAGAGLARATFGATCLSGAYDRRAPSADYHGEAPVSRPDLLALHDFGDAWRDRAQGDVGGLRSVVADAAYAGGGGALDPWVGDAAVVSGESAPTLPMRTAFPAEDRGLPALSWRDGKAWLGDAPLEQGRARVGSTAFDAPTDLGPPLHVLHRYSVTYLGQVDVRLHARDGDCRTPGLPVLPGPWGP